MALEAVGNSLSLPRLFPRNLAGLQIKQTGGFQSDRHETTYILTYQTIKLAIIFFNQQVGRFLETEHYKSVVLNNRTVQIIQNQRSDTSSKDRKDLAGLFNGYLIPWGLFEPGVNGRKDTSLNQNGGRWTQGNVDDAAPFAHPAAQNLNLSKASSNASDATVVIAFAHPSDRQLSAASKRVDDDVLSGFTAMTEGRTFTLSDADGNEVDILEEYLDNADLIGTEDGVGKNIVWDGAFYRIVAIAKNS